MSCKLELLQTSLSFEPNTDATVWSSRSKSKIQNETNVSHWEEQLLAFVRCLIFRRPVYSGQIQRAAPCNFGEGLCSCPAISVEPHTAGRSGRPESPVEKHQRKWDANWNFPLKSRSCLTWRASLPSATFNSDEFQERADENRPAVIRFCVTLGKRKIMIITY